MAEPRPTGWKVNLRGRVDEYVVRVLESIQNTLTTLQQQLIDVKAKAGLPVNMDSVKTSLQAGGSNPLNVEGLLGHLGQPQTGGAPSLAANPSISDPITQDGALFVLVGSPNTLYRVNASHTPPTFDPIGGSGSVTSVATGTGLTGGPITTTGTISLANTAVSAGSYTLASITVDAQGRLTAASSGGAGLVSSLFSAFSGANGTTVETTLATYTLPANTLNVDGKAIRVTAFLNLAATANTKTIKLYFGATLVANLATANQAGFHISPAIIIRTGAATQNAWSRVGTTNVGTGNETQNQNLFTTPTETLSGTVVIKITGQSSAASNDVLLRGFTIELLN